MEEEEHLVSSLSDTAFQKIKSCLVNQKKVEGFELTEKSSFLDKEMREEIMYIFRFTNMVYCLSRI